MKYVTHASIVLDVNNTNIQVVRAKQYNDYSRVIDITVVDGDNKINLNNFDVYFKALTPNNNEILTTCTKNADGSVTVVLDDNILYSPGKINAEIEIVSSDGFLSTMSFIINVIASPYNDDKITATDDFSALVDALERVESFSEHINNIYVDDKTLVIERAF